MKGDIQKTFGIIKPDAVERNLVGTILARIEESGLEITDLKMICMSEALATEFYKEHKKRSFFNELVDYMTSGKIVVFSVKGSDAVKKYRELMGSTDPNEAREGTLRKIFALSKSKNSVHGSDSIESANRELSLFF